MLMVGLVEETACSSVRAYFSCLWRVDTMGACTFYLYAS